MRTRSLRAAPLALLLPLASCVNMSGLSGESKYACAAPEGVACDSVSGTYANAVHNNLPSQRGRAAPPSPRAAEAAPPPAAPARQPVTGAIRAVALPGPDGQANLALRSQARVLRLWTKPWEDADGDLWDQGFVYVQVDAGRWQIDHVRQRIRDQYVPLRPPPAPAVGASTGGSGSAPASPSETESPNPADSAVQRPPPFGAFPSRTRPPSGLGSRPQ